MRAVVVTAVFFLAASTHAAEVCMLPRISANNFGAIPGGPATANAVAIQAAWDAAAAHPGAVASSIVPAVTLAPGVYEFDTTLVIPAIGLRFQADGAQLKFTGLGNAIEIGAVFGYSPQTDNLELSGFDLVGNALADDGIDLTKIVSGNIMGAVIEGVEVRDFTKVGSWGLDLADFHASTVTSFRVSNCYNGVRLGSDTIDAVFTSLQVDAFTGTAVESNSNIAQTNTLIGGELATGLGTTNIAVLLTDGSLTLQGTHIETVATPISALVGAIRVIGVSMFDATEPVVFADGVHASIIGTEATVTIQAGQGTIWDQTMHAVTPPAAVTPGAYTVPATVARIQGVGTFYGFPTAGAKVAGSTTMVFESDGVILDSGNTGMTVGYIMTRDGQDWNPRTGDSITFKRSYGGPTPLLGPWVETARTSRTSELTFAAGRHQTARGDHTRIHHNKGALGLVEFDVVKVNLAGANPNAAGLRYRYLRVENQEIKVHAYWRDLLTTEAGTDCTSLVLETVGAAVDLEVLCADCYDGDGLGSVGGRYLARTSGEVTCIP